jgi:hypothetical protein
MRVLLALQSLTPRENGPRLAAHFTSGNGSNWQYDAVGNLIDDGKRIYTWDAAKRLIRVQEKSTAQKSEFAYDGLSRMTVRKEYASATATPSEVR